MSIARKVALVAAIATLGAVPAAQAGTTPITFKRANGTVVGTMKHDIRPALITEDGCDNQNTSEVRAEGLTPGKALLLYRNGVAVPEADGEIGLDGRGQIRILAGHGIDLHTGDTLTLVEADEVRTQTDTRDTRVITFENPVAVASAQVPASLASTSC